MWQIFNNGSLPHTEHSNEELLNRYLEIKEHQNNHDASKNNITTQGLQWFPLKLEIPEQKTMKLNKMLQKLINFILTDYLDNQVKCTHSTYAHLHAHIHTHTCTHTNQKSLYCIIPITFLNPGKYIYLFT